MVDPDGLVYDIVGMDVYAFGVKFCGSLSHQSDGCPLFNGKLKSKPPFKAIYGLTDGYVGNDVHPNTPIHWKVKNSCVNGRFWLSTKLSIDTSFEKDNVYDWLPSFTETLDMLFGVKADA